MRVHLPLSTNVSTGKGNFVQRLAKELKQYVVINEGKEFDIALHLIKIKKKINARNNVIRYDGIYHNTAQDYKAINSDIAGSMKKANGAIYQSQFSKIMCERYLGKFNGKSCVIFNGIDVSSYNSIKPIKSSFGINVIAVANWRPHKRLRDIIECFLLSDVPDSCLWVIGDLTRSGLSKQDIKIYQQKNVKFSGQLKQVVLSRYYALCQISIHLCWFDWCPNSVVESIAADCIVISNNVGGTHELVSRSNGIVCNIDEEYNYKPVELYKPPKFDRRIVAEAINNAVRPRVINKECIDIKNIAKQYFEFFKEINDEH
jgi:glycosyltransferase involved in cell wall biosynthesis